MPITKELQQKRDSNKQQIIMCDVIVLQINAGCRGYSLNSSFKLSKHGDIQLLRVSLVTKDRGIQFNSFQSLLNWLEGYKTAVCTE